MFNKSWLNYYIQRISFLLLLLCIWYIFFLNRPHNGKWDLHLLGKLPMQFSWISLFSWLKNWTRMYWMVCDQLQLIISGYLTRWQSYLDICLKRYTFYWFFFQKFPVSVSLYLKLLQQGTIYIFFYDVALLTSVGNSINFYIHVMNCGIITNLHLHLLTGFDGSLVLLYWVL